MLVLHVTLLVLVPQFVHASLVEGFVDDGQACPPHVPHAQLLEHVCVPPTPQDCVVPAAHTPAPVQVPNVPVTQLPVFVLHVTVLVCVPQLPQDCVVEGLLELGQVCPVHAPQLPQLPPVQFAVQVLVCVPLLPQVWLVGCVWLGLQQLPLYTDPPQLLVLFCVPQPVAHALVNPPPYGAKQVPL